MAPSKPPGEQAPEDDTPLLTTALNHYWAWYDGRSNRAFQIVNYYLLASAILATAYVGAINTKNHGLAVAVAVAETGLTALSSIAWLHEANAAALAEPALIELQERMARRLRMDSMRIARSRPRILRWRTIVASAFGLSALLNVSGLLYAVIF